MEYNPRPSQGYFTQPKVWQVTLSHNHLPPPSLRGAQQRGSPAVWVPL